MCRGWGPARGQTGRPGQSHLAPATSSALGKDFTSLSHSFRTRGTGVTFSLWVLSEGACGSQPPPRRRHPCRRSWQGPRAPLLSRGSSGVGSVTLALRPDPPAVAWPQKRGRWHPLKSAPEGPWSPAPQGPSGYLAARWTGSRVPGPPWGVVRRPSLRAALHLRTPLLHHQEPAGLSLTWREIEERFRKMAAAYVGSLTVIHCLSNYLA